MSDPAEHLSKVIKTKQAEENYATKRDIYAIGAVILFIAAIFGIDRFINRNDITPVPEPVVSANLTGPTSVKFGGVAKFTITNDNILDPKWRVYPSGVEIISSDRSAFLESSTPGKYTVLVAGVLDGKTFLEERGTLVREPINPNPIPPGPNPGPNPVPPPGPAPVGFALEVAQRATGLPKADCIALATNYETVASVIAAGGITKLEDAVVKITELNKSLSLDKTKWAAFATWLGSQYNEKAQTLKEAQKLAEDTAVGLRYAGK